MYDLYIKNNNKAMCVSFYYLLDPKSFCNRIIVKTVYIYASDNKHFPQDGTNPDSLTHPDVTSARFLDLLLYACCNFVGLNLLLCS